MNFTWKTFRQPKQGHSAKEYEDASAGDPQAGRFAVADGASESAFAGAWARILVNAYVRSSGPWSRWLPAARKRWRTRVQVHDLPWYTETKFKEGAHAALLGITIAENDWQAQAVGDCCLFHVQNDTLQRCFPICHAADFSNQPSLLGSRPRRDYSKIKRKRMRGSSLPGDVFFLMTDALAKWFLVSVEDRKKPWRALLEFEDNEQFADLVEQLRRADQIHNDDVTLLRIASR